jgi:hypothetical protein
MVPVSTVTDTELVSEAGEDLPATVAGEADFMVTAAGAVSTVAGEVPTAVTAASEVVSTVTADGEVSAATELAGATESVWAVFAAAGAVTDLPLAFTATDTVSAMVPDGALALATPGAGRNSLLLQHY